MEFWRFPHSKLFMNVREKEHLAYYASSSIDTFRGFMTVQTESMAKSESGLAFDFDRIGKYSLR